MGTYQEMNIPTREIVLWVSFDLFSERIRRIVVVVGHGRRGIEMVVVMGLRQGYRVHAPPY